jgi:hypothetical protein
MKKMLLLSLSCVFALTTACATQPKPSATPVPTPSPFAQAETAQERTPAKVTAAGDDDYEVEWCGSSSDSGKKFQVLKSGNALVGGRLNASGCFSTTLRNGRVQPGDNLVYTVDDKNRASETVPRRAGGGGNNGGNRPSPQPIPQPTPSLPAYDIRKVENSADDHARCVANAVVGLYGRAEAYRYSFYQGFRSGLALFDLSNLGQVRNSTEYREGYNRGEPDGERAGSRAGDEQGREMGSRKAAQDVTARYSAIIDQNQPPDLSKPSSGSNFEGLRADISDPESIEARIISVNQEYRNEMMRLQFENDGDRYVWNDWNDNWSLITYYRWGTNYQFELVNSAYRDDWAFDLFRRQGFSRCRDQSDYYSKITNSSTYSNADEAGRVYRRIFKREYDRVIDSKWVNVIRQGDTSATLRGIFYGNKVARDYAYDLGYKTAYRLSYTHSSATAYNSVYTISYNDRFDAEVRRFEGSVIPRFDEGYLIGADGEKNSIVVGMPIGIDLVRVVNLGRQPGEVSVSVQGTEVDSPVAKKISLMPSSSLKEGRKQENLGLVSANVRPDQEMQVIMRVGNESKAGTIRNDWKMLVSIAGERQLQVQQMQLNYITTQLLEEVKKNYGGVFNNWQDKDESLLKRTVEVIERMAPANKQKFVGMSASIKQAIGKRPGFFSLGASQAEWDAISAYLKRIE